MSIVNLIRNRSGFNNMPDYFSVCAENNPEGYFIDELTQEFEIYQLPVGYRVAESKMGEWFVYGPNGHCEIFEHRPTGRPQLFDGTLNAPVLKRA